MGPDLHVTDVPPHDLLVPFAYRVKHDDDVKRSIPAFQANADATSTLREGRVLSLSKVLSDIPLLHRDPIGTRRKHESLTRVTNEISREKKRLV